MQCGPKQCHLVQGFSALAKVLQQVNIDGASFLMAADIEDDTALVFKGIDLMEIQESFTAVLPRQDLHKEHKSEASGSSPTWWERMTDIRLDCWKLGGTFGRNMFAKLQLL